MLNTGSFFEAIFNNAKQNGMIIMGEDGIIQKVNDAFTNAYGYTTDDLESKHFRILFIERDQVTRRPEMELTTTKREGSSNDENYLVHKDGTRIWVTGESIYIKDENITCIVKIVHNIEAQKQLERYLLDSSDLLDSLFESIQQTGLLLLSTQMRTIKANKAFTRMFGSETEIPEGNRLSQLNHSFWAGDEIRNDIKNAIVNNLAINKQYTIEEDNNTSRVLHLTSKLIVNDDLAEKKLLLIIKETNPD